MIRSKFVCFYIQAAFVYLTLLLQFARAQEQTNYLASYCSENGHYDSGSEYQNNLSLLLSNLTSKSSKYKFYNLTVGEVPNKVYGLFLCNNFYSNQACNDCMLIAEGEIRARCQSSIEATVWYTACMLRYANHSIFSVVDLSIFYNVQGGLTRYSQYNQQLTDTFVSLLNEASSGNSPLFSAARNVYVTKVMYISSYVDCTPDLNPADCKKCLQTALARLQLVGGQSGALLQPNCRLMYAFDDAGAISPEKSGKGKFVIALGVTSAVAASSLLLSVVVILCLKRKSSKSKPAGLEEIESMENLHFEFDAIKAATDNFSSANKLGQGGFGIVYKGTLADGQAVAVKRLSNASGQGVREFKAEASLAAKLQHNNLVKLFGFCVEGDEMLLVYEFVPNNSLDRHLFDPNRGVNLKWEARYKIIIGIARGLLYLHEDSRPKIVHRDLKPSNILLDADMNPKIADFGMAKLFGVDQTQGDTSRVAGTFGYMAPEYVATGHFSAKSDMFSFGVILLEIAWRLWDEGAHLRLVDSSLRSIYSKDEVERCIHVGLLCVQEDPTKRPTIASVLLMLNTQPITLPKPASPTMFPYRREKPVISHGSCSFGTDDDISILSAR